MAELERCSADEIRRLEERALNAWPALQSLIVDGWIVRLSDGYTKRANSVNAWAPRAPLERVLGQATALYASCGLPTTVRLTPLAPDGTDELLAALGFTRLDETIVMTSCLATSSAVDAHVTFHASPVEAWSNGFAEANRIPSLHRQTHDRMLAAIAQPVTFASISEGGEALGWGLAAIERDYVGLFDIATAANARRRGIARRLVSSLLAFASGHGATSAYLQVVATNDPAIALYRSLGFAEAYRYHYRVGPG